MRRSTASVRHSARQRRSSGCLRDMNPACSSASIGAAVSHPAGRLEISRTAAPVSPNLMWQQPLSTATENWPPDGNAGSNQRRNKDGSLRLASSILKSSAGARSLRTSLGRLLSSFLDGQEVLRRVSAQVGALGEIIPQ